MPETKNELKVVINDPKEGKSYQKIAPEGVLTGKKIGDTVSGSFIGLTGYELQITGGSNIAGTPMYKLLSGSAKRKVLLGRGFGARIRKGKRLRKTLMGNTFIQSSTQINMKVIKHGTKSIVELLGIQPKEEQKPTVAKEQKKETPTPEEQEQKKEAAKEKPQKEEKKK